MLNKEITLNSSPIAIVSNFKTLGVIFQETLCWDAHIDCLATKLSQVIGIVYRNRQILPQNIMMLIFNSLFQSRLNYCHLVWGTTTQRNLHTILVLQKKFLRVIENVPSYFHTREYFLKYRVLPVTTLYDYRLCRAYKQELKTRSDFLKHLSKLQINATLYATRKKEYWEIATVRTIYGKQTLGNILPRLLNRLITEGLQVETTTFKAIRSYFDQKTNDL